MPRELTEAQEDAKAWLMMYYAQRATAYPTVKFYHQRFEAQLKHHSGITSVRSSGPIFEEFWRQIDIYKGVIT